MKKFILLLVTCINFSVLYAQEQDKQILFTINDKPFYTDEFIRVYNKNLELVKDDSQKDLDNYLDLFIGYKLKVEKAKKIGLQDGTSYKSELNSYRTQLAKNYLNDNEVTNQLLEQAYERMKYEVRASHILVMIPEGALPQDTLNAYRKLYDIKKRIESGENFETLAEKFSEDPSAKMNKGDLGYFTAFRMVYPFENAAYTTEVGKLSNIVKTRFGYHLLKVTDKRLNRGDVIVKHIMLLNTENKESETKIDVSKNINELYQKILQGESFEELAKQFSDDKSTASKGGLLQRFSSGQLTSKEFEDVAFGLSKKDEVSKPFQTQFGWHIVKLVERFPLQSYDELKNEIEANVKRDERSRVITNSLLEKIKKKYQIKTDTKQLKQIEKVLTNELYEGKWEMPKNTDSFDKPLAAITKENTLLAVDFLKFLESQQKIGFTTKPLKSLVQEQLAKWQDEELLKFYDSNLENEFPEFKYVMNEYRDGLLLFDLMEKEIWNRAKQDTISQQEFYNNNQNKYVWKDKYEVEIYSSVNEKDILKARKYIQKNKSISYIKSKINKDDKVNVVVKNGTFENDFDILPDFKSLEKGATEIIQKGNYFFVANIKNKIPSHVKSFEECKGNVISDYQQYLEENWVKELKKEFNVSINQEIFQKVKSNLVK